MKCNFLHADTEANPAVTQEELSVPGLELPASKPNSRISYTSLPGEIRNKIMGLVLCPGIVYLRAKLTRQSFTSYSNDPHLARNGTQSSPPGIQLLATCHQVYNEGHVMYYSNNVFDLPPGPLVVTRELFANIQPEYIALMKHFSLRASLLDLTPPLLDNIERKAAMSTRPRWSWLFNRSSGHPPRDRLAYHEGHKLEIEAKLVLTAIWEGKLSYLAAKFPTMTTLDIRTTRLPKDGGATTYHLEQVRAVVIVGGNSFITTTSKFRLDQNGSWNQPIYLAVPGAGKMVSRKVRNMGWERFKSSITPQAVLAFERDVQKVSRSEPAYILNRWGSGFSNFAGQFLKSLESIQMAVEGPPLSANVVFYLVSNNIH